MIAVGDRHLERPSHGVCTSTSDFEIGEEQLKDTAGQDVEPTLAHTRRLQALSCQKWRSAIRKRDFERARQIMASKKPPLESRAALAPPPPPPPLPPSGGAALNILTYVPMPADLLHVKGIYRVEQLNALAQVVAHKEGDPTILHVVLHEGSELDVSALEWYAQDGPHDMFEKPPTPTHEKCTTDRKKLEELKKHAERWLAAYESAELYRKVENQAPDAAHIPQEDGDELEDGDLEVEIVSDDSDCDVTESVILSG